MIKGNVLQKKVPSEENVSDILAQLSERKLEITAIETKWPTLEDYFVKMLGRRETE
jgi:ABC-type multidrug transport system ATPase subunit